MAGYTEQGYNQDFYQSGYDLDEVLQQQQAPPSGWQASGVPAREQWSGAGQQMYYPPSYDQQQQQAHGQQGVWAGGNPNDVV